MPFFMFTIQTRNNPHELNPQTGPIQKAHCKYYHDSSQYSFGIWLHHFFLGPSLMPHTFLCKVGLNPTFPTCSTSAYLWGIPSCSIAGRVKEKWSHRRRYALNKRSMDKSCRQRWKVKVKESSITLRLCPIVGSSAILSTSHPHSEISGRRVLLPLSQ